MLKPGITATHLHYRGPQIDERRKLRMSGITSFYLIEVEDYVDVEG